MRSREILIPSLIPPCERKTIFLGREFYKNILNGNWDIFPPLPWRLEHLQEVLITQNRTTWEMQWAALARVPVHQNPLPQVRCRPGGHVNKHSTTPVVGKVKPQSTKTEQTVKHKAPLQVTGLETRVSTSFSDAVAERIRTYSSKLWCSSKKWCSMWYWYSEVYKN